MADIATMPASCEARDVLGKRWAVQAKPAGAEPTEWAFIPGLTSVDVNEEITTVDSTTIDMGDYSRTSPVGKALTVTLNGIYQTAGDLGTYSRVQTLIKVATTELGAAVDLRVWRTDVGDEGWEATFTGTWQSAGNAPGELRSFVATMSPSCEPTRIKSVLKGSETEESVPIDMAEYLSILEPSTPVNPDPEP